MSFNLENLFLVSTPTTIPIFFLGYYFNNNFKGKKVEEKGEVKKNEEDECFIYKY